MSVTLRALGVESLDSALSFVKAYFDHDGLAFNPDVANGVRELLEDANLGTFWAICEGAAEVGYVVLTYAFDHEFGGRIGVATDFFLLEEGRGRGIGSEVLSLVERAAREKGLHAIELFVLDHNPRARLLYERLGYVGQTDRMLFAKSLI